MGPTLLARRPACQRAWLVGSNCRCGPPCLQHRPSVSGRRNSDYDGCIEKVRPPIVQQRRLLGHRVGVTHAELIEFIEVRSDIGIEAGQDRLTRSLAVY